MNDMAVEYKRRLFTVAEYHRLAEAGVLGENDGVELIDGELIEMPPIGPQHVSLHARITHYLNDTLRERATVLPMGSFPLGDRNEPRPDIAVFPYDRDMYARRAYPPPSGFVAFIEIATSSFAFDSGVKMRLYATHGTRVPSRRRAAKSVALGNPVRPAMRRFANMDTATCFRSHSCRRSNSLPTPFSISATK